MGQIAPPLLAQKLTIVPCPRASDGVGAALRDAYAGDAILPRDMAGLLDLLCNDRPARPR